MARLEQCAASAEKCRQTTNAADVSRTSVRHFKEGLWSTALQGAHSLSLGVASWKVLGRPGINDADMHLRTLLHIIKHDVLWMKVTMRHTMIMAMANGQTKLP